MTPEEFYESLQEKKPFTKLTSTGISDNLPNVFEFAKMYAEVITVTRCCETLNKNNPLSFMDWIEFNEYTTSNIGYVDKEKNCISLDELWQKWHKYKESL